MSPENKTSRRRWFLRFMLRSLTERVGRVFVAVFSVTIAVGIVISALGISGGIREKLGQELKAYGANVIVSAPAGLDQKSVASVLASVQWVQEHTLQLYGSVAPGDGPDLEIIGMSLYEAGDWKIDGRLPVEGAAEALVGSNIRALMGLQAGGKLSFARKEITVAGFVERGGPEDGAVILWLKEAQELLGRSGEVSAALVRAEPGRVEEVVSAIRRKIPGAEVKTLRQVAGAEEEFLHKIELLMALVSIVVLISASISLSSTMSATVLERLKEIGLMKAIGGTRGEIGMFFLSEGIFIGLAGGIVGYVLGVAAAMAVSKGAFGSVIAVPVELIPPGIIMGVVISVVASFVPLIGALGLKPSVILRGE